MRIKTSSALSEKDISDLFSDKFLALVIPNYYPQELSLRLADKILKEQGVQPYTHEIKKDGQLTQEYFGVDRLGFPFNMTYNLDAHHPIVEQYYQQARSGIHRLRTLSAPGINPIDKLRLELDEIQPQGATVGAFQNKKMLAGIGRITKASLSHLSADEPHFDALPERYLKLDSQFAANIYLKVPTSGGELEVWDVPPMKPLAVVPKNWRSSLPQSIKIKPNVGDLVIFNCRRPHAICSFSGEDRVTVQMFIGLQENQPLQLWN